ncbi:hypothetical protein Aph01nite_33590 [Acrocarpospora phusangensis]|uniref:Uncharacterized protein n=1 Tax=Acrocarpospora phusangensis TaxID=1070424 RepID=A0A919Q9K8_9ACTN|nr:hypothetical protein [Acrocarpospora phusangensis]GIH25049.1 hypothetical protein Aph01nite_33590 [Acrocarpospora phusangensis]
MKACDQVALALDVPAAGAEAADWRARGLAELLVCSRATGDMDLVAAVDDAAAGLPPVQARLAFRLRTLRTRMGPLRTPYPAERPRDLVPSAPSSVVRRHAVQLARLADRLARTPATSRGPLVADARAVESALAETMPWRAAARPHPCRDVSGLAGLTWRNWMLVGGGPCLVTVPCILSAEQTAVWFGVHVGTHLDHMAALLDEGRPDLAHRIQFGAGVLVAEGVAMAAELTLPRLPGADGLRQVWYDGVVERLARLPRLPEWGPGMAPESEAMARAAAAPNPEFTTLPRYAEAYVSKAFQLAEKHFRDPLIPDGLRDRLDRLWRREVVPLLD